MTRSMPKVVGVLATVGLLVASMPAANATGVLCHAEVTWQGGRVTGSGGCLGWAQVKLLINGNVVAQCDNVLNGNGLDCTVNVNIRGCFFVQTWAHATVVVNGQLQEVRSPSPFVCV